MTDLEMYQRLRKAAEENIREKRKKGKIRAVLGYSKCSVSVGAGSVLKALQEVISEAEIDDVIIETTGCIGLCSKEPLLDIFTSDGERYTYELVDAKMAKAIVISHSLYNENIEDWLLKN
ncbi:(2Fe-2S) ferredoxin domain-containing protein [Sporosalibacterium faouarense]|uniref:(2Fe-2S) ferredoxin domain-containing protein n=1 Tax=Sporosalibacterium faouarense TaxID=516123 RepID=UPI00141D12F3|nr:(2Fe-2S) ferredoxin domain-containing protein [Sporosalibacterium faouarense]MTI46199.1 (2Fe-2S) ferredoxin domain-containing protein [Bacillota bacterium]